MSAGTLFPAWKGARWELLELGEQTPALCSCSMPHGERLLPSPCLVAAIPLPADELLLPIFACQVQVV